MKLLVLGLGNPILGDDGIGIRVVKKLEQILDQLNSVITVETSSVGGMDLAELVLGYDYVILVDAILDTSLTPGQIIIKEINGNSQALHISNPHDVNFVTAIEVFKKISPELIPKKILLVGIAVSDRSFVFSDRISSYLEPSVNKAINLLLTLINSFMEGQNIVETTC
ncbi:MAG: hydrogenase maturation protease [Candidatus Asgardarchaeia archaeon]